MTYYQTDKIHEVSERKNGKVFLSLLIMFVLVGLSVFYLVQVNNLVAKNFELRNFQKKLSQSQKESQSLDVVLTQIRSLDNLQQAAKNLNLVSIEKVDYLKIDSSFFALSD